MALEVSMTGTGTIGNIAPGWSLNEYTNSITIGETGAGTGSVSFNARATETSLLVINNNITSTIGELGTVEGVVQSISQTGMSATISHGTIADKLNLDINLPPIPSGGVEAWCAELEDALNLSGQIFDFTGYAGGSVAAYPATSGVAWELLQQLAAAENFEFAIIADTIYIRDVGTTAFDITNIGATPTINPQSTLSGKEILIPYTEASYITGTVYDAEQDGNNIISVDAGGTTVTSVKWNVSPITVNNPTRSDTWPVADGEYYVIDSEGLPLFAEEWEAYGAYVTATIDPDDSSAIQITVKGPTTDTTLAGGPYRLAASDSGVEYGALKLSGTGVYAGDKSLTLITGIDPDKYTRATVNTITNPFIGTLEQAYDRGVWASLKASGPTVSLRMSVPISSLSGIGLTCGSLIDYNYSTYRIMACSISGIMANITADFYATVARVDESWDGVDVQDYDLSWSRYECQDQIIFPYFESTPPPI